MRNMDQSLDEYHSANDESFCLNNNNNNDINSPINYHMASPMLTSGGTTTLGARKQLLSHDSNNGQTTMMTEPAKPLSPYALFFKDTVSAIKQQNPTCSFQELSRIVASMWEVLDEEHKNVYNQRHEEAKRDYINQLHLFRQQQLQRANSEENASYQTKPAVFTINRSSTESISTAGGGGNAIDTSSTQPPKSVNSQSTNSTTTPANAAAAAAPANAPGENDSSGARPTLCTRENCNKMAIINPDWEDEYCSNECVVIHCRNVFNSWVQSNIEARAQ